MMNLYSLYSSYLSMAMNDSVKRARFTKLLNNKPKAGTLLESISGAPVPLIIDENPATNKGLKRVMFAHATIDEDGTGWYLCDSSRGLKCLILPESQEKIIENNHGSLVGLKIKTLRVVRQTSKKTALICELT